MGVTDVRSYLRGSVKGSSVEGDVTSTSVDANTQALDVAIKSGGGGAVTVADGADVALGTTTDAATANTVVGRLKKLVSLLPAALGSATSAASLPVVIASDQASVAVTAAQATASSLNAQAVGSVASGAADSGNPVKVGAKFNSTRPTFTDGQRGDLQVDSRGHLDVAMYDGPGANRAAVLNAGDGNSAQIGLATFSQTTVWNPTAAQSELQRSNFDTAALITASGATTTQTGADQTNRNNRGVIVVLDMTTVGTGSVTLEIDGKDAASGKYYALLTGAAVVTNSTNVYYVYPGATAAANVSASAPLPRVWRVKVTANNANATTYTVGASIIN